MRVVHCEKEPFDVYIGRPSKWGNIYSHLDDTLAEFKVATRKDAIEAYEKWIRQNDELMAALDELDGKVLGCWCDPPKACHGHILIKLLKEKRLEDIFKL